MVPDQPARRSTLSRRGLLKGGGVVAFGGLSVAALKLPMFGIDPVQACPNGGAANDVSSSERELIISNWTGYIDPPRNPNSTLPTFEDQTGITVTYNVDVNDNAEFYAKVRNQMRACEPIDRDMIILTDWMAAKLINLGWIQPLSRSTQVDVKKKLIPALQGVPWDEDRTYSAPWQSGLTGIAYNADLVPEVGSFEELITREDLHGRITLLSEMNDTMGFFLKVVGADPVDFSDDEWADALDLLKKTKEDGQLRQFAGNNYLQQLSQGTLVACEAWSGDVIQAQVDNPNLKFVVPEEGLSLWSDNMLVPNYSTHQENAEAWIDYYYQPEVAAKLAAWVNYICPVAGAQEAMLDIDPALAENPLIFPDSDMLANTWDFMTLDDEQQQKYEGEWADVISS